MEMFRERYMKRYFGYFNCMHILEVIFRIFGAIWAIEILILNTGSAADREESKWYADKNSLQTTIWVTFSVPIILIGAQIVGIATKGTLKASEGEEMNAF